MYDPNLELPEDEEPHYGKYGRTRNAFLQKHRKAYHTTLLFDGMRVTCLNETDDSDNSTMELLITQMAEK